MKKTPRFKVKYFENLIYTNAMPIQNVIQTLMSTLFTLSEVRKAVWTVKNNKSPGTDQINVELINYSPEVVYEKNRR